MESFMLHNRTKTFILLAICFVLAIVTAVVGVDDNPPGILLAYLAAIAFVLALVHPWRTSRKFSLLLVVSVLGLVLFVILNNLFAAIGHDPGTVEALQTPMQGLAVVAFFLATLIFPAGFIVGAIGAVIMYIRNRRRSV